jgi:CelD/BcsL family acetyltransferase involved in cellulose biosynthesis
MISVQNTQLEFDIQVLESVDDLQAFVSDWEAFLAEGVSGSSFFNDPAHILSRLELEPQTTPWIVVLRCGDRICCIAPFFLHETRLRIEFSIIKLASLPVCTLKAYGGNFIAHKDADAEVCYRHIFETLWQNRSKFGVILLEDLRVATPLWKYFEADLSRDTRFRRFLASSRVDNLHQTRLPATHAEFLTQLNPRTRQRLRRQARKLCDEKHARLEKFVSPEHVQRFVSQVDEIYRDTWQAKLVGYCHRDPEFHCRFLTRISERGWLRSYTLVVDQQPVAYLLGYQHGGIYYYYEIGYRQQWADDSPGAVLTYLFIEELFQEDPPQLVDYLVGDQPYKRSLSNLQLMAASIYLAPPNRWRLVLRVQQLLHLMSRPVVRALAVFRLDRMVRKRFMVHH